MRKNAQEIGKRQRSQPIRYGPRYPFALKKEIENEASEERKIIRKNS